jgi:hypothetical protein
MWVYKLIKQPKNTQVQPTQFYGYVFEKVTSFSPNLGNHQTKREQESEYI